MRAAEPAEIDAAHQASTKQEEPSTAFVLFGLLIGALSLAFPLFMIYLLVRFVKWAWVG